MIARSAPTWTGRSVGPGFPTYTTCSPLVFQDGATWRKQLRAEIADASYTPGLVARYGDDEFARFMIKLAAADSLNPGSRVRYRPKS